jgi:hypothetical protein
VTITYAAVAANISTGLAFVKSARTKENTAEKPTMAPNLESGSLMRYNPKTAREGRRADKTTFMVRAKRLNPALLKCAIPVLSWPYIGFCVRCQSNGKHLDDDTVHLKRVEEEPVQPRKDVLFDPSSEQIVC